MLLHTTLAAACEEVDVLEADMRASNDSSRRWHPTCRM